MTSIDYEEEKARLAKMLLNLEKPKPRLKKLSSSKYKLNTNKILKNKLQTQKIVDPNKYDALKELENLKEELSKKNFGEEKKRKKLE